MKQPPRACTYTSPEASIQASSTHTLCLSVSPSVLNFGSRTLLLSRACKSIVILFRFDCATDKKYWKPIQSIRRQIGKQNCIHIFRIFGGKTGNSRWSNRQDGCKLYQPGISSLHVLGVCGVGVGGGSHWYTTR